MKNKASLIVFSILVVFSFGCSRDIEESSSVTFDFSSSGSQTSQSVQTEIDFIAINVSGPGMPRMICRLDVGDSDDGQIPRWAGPCIGSGDPNSRVVEIPGIPAGNDRLVQVLMIRNVENTATGDESEFFDYGEARTALKAGDNQVDIRMTANETSSSKDMTAAGRIRMPDGSYYTGPYALQFTPPSGSQPMTIFNFEMFDGWFFAFLLDNIDLTYSLPNGEILWGQPVNQNSPMFGPSSHVMKITQPETFYDRDGSTESDNERTLAYGFWIGANQDSSKTACYDMTAEDENHNFIDSGLTDVLSWPADFTIEGGSSCSVPNPAVNPNSLAVNADMMLDGGGDGPASFIGPYQWFLDSNSEYSPIDGTTVAGGFELSWRYLPGVLGGGSKVAGTAVFFKAPPIEERFKDIMEGGSRGFDCKKLQEAGYSRRNATGSSNKVVIPGTVTEVIDIMDNGQIVMCPFKQNGEFFRTVLDLRNDDNGGGGGPQPAEAIRLTNLGPVTFPHMNTSTCTPVTVQFVDGSNNLAHPPQSGPYEIDFAQNEGAFYEFPGCTGIISTVTIHNGSPETTVYYLGSTATNPLNITASTTPGMPVTLTSGNLSLELQNFSGNPASRIEALTVPFDYFDTKCEVFPVFVADASGAPTSNFPAGDITVSLNKSGASAGPYGDFYQPGNCGMGGTFTTLTVTSGNPVTALEYLAAGDDSVTIDSGNPNGLANFSTNISTRQTPYAEYAVIEGGGDVQGTSFCNQRAIATYWYDSASGRPIPAYPSGSVTYTLGTTVLSDSNFYTGGCPSPGGLTPTLVQSGAQKRVNFEFNSSDTGPIDFQFNIDADDDRYDILNLPVRLNP